MVCEREKVSIRVYVREKVCVFVRARERECLCGWVPGLGWTRELVRIRKREREKV